MQLSGASAQNSHPKDSRVKIEVNSQMGDSKIRRSSRVSKMVQSTNKMQKSKHRKSTHQKTLKKSYYHFKFFEKPLKTVQSKIFQEVICLLNEISQIEMQIRKQTNLINLLQQQITNTVNKEKGNRWKDLRILLERREDMSEKKYGITIKQLEGIQLQCKQIEENIESLQLGEKQNLQQMILQEETENENLLRILENFQQKSASDNEDLTAIGKAKKIQEKIEEFLQQNQQNYEKKQAVKYYLKEVESIREQILSISRAKTKDIETSGEKQERERLEAYIKEENSGKMLFMEELSNFKREYEQLQAQNEELKRRVSNL